MTDLLADFEDCRGVPGQRLKVDLVLADLDRDAPAKAKALRDVLADPKTWPARVVSRTLTTKWGIRLSQAAVINWRTRYGMLDG